MNEENFFLINRGDLDGWLSPLFYAYKTDKIKNGKKLREISNINPFRKKPKLEKTDLVPYVGLPETNNLEVRNVLRRPLSEVEGRNIFLRDDILFARIEPSIFNQKYILADSLNKDDYAYTSTEFYIVKAKEVKDQRYIFYTLFTDVVYNQVKGKTTGSTGRRRLDKDVFEKIIIPYPDNTVRKEVIKIMDSAVLLKNKLENRNKEILENIDKYLLQELNVILPEDKENSIQNRIFKTEWNKLTGNRFDPKKYSYQSESLIACIENSKLRKVPLKSLVVHSVAGDWGLDEKEEVNPKLFTKCLVIRATEFDNNYNLNIENSRAKFRLISNTKLKKLDIKPQDFLLEKSGGSPDQPVGRISILENELLVNNTIAYSNFIHKFRVNSDEVLPEFLFCFLKTIHNIKLTDVMQSQTNGIRNLIMREYWNQSIILPNKTKQKEIADTIYQMRAEAKQTEMDAQQGFEQTKKEIEKLILE